MSNPIFNNLLAMDAHAQKLGMGLHPKLRAALEAEQRFPARSSGPEQDADVTPDITPEFAAVRAASRNSA